MVGSSGVEDRFPGMGEVGESNFTLGRFNCEAETSVKMYLNYGICSDPEYVLDRVP